MIRPSHRLSAGPQCPLPVGPEAGTGVADGGWRVKWPSRPNCSDGGKAPDWQPVTVNESARRRSVMSTILSRERAGVDGSSGEQVSCSVSTRDAVSTVRGDAFKAETSWRVGTGKDRSVEGDGPRECTCIERSRHRHRRCRIRQQRPERDGGCLSRPPHAGARRSQR